MMNFVRLAAALVMVTGVFVDAAHAQAPPMPPRTQPETGPGLAGSAAPGFGSAAPTTPAAPAPDAGPKDPAVAFALSLGTTLLGNVLAQASNPFASASSTGNIVAYAGGALAVVGPTVGHIYAGDTLNAGLGIRIVGLGLVVASLANLKHGAFGDEFDISSTGLLELAAGAVLNIAGTSYEIATAASAARAYNRAHATRAVGWSIAPTLGPSRARVAPGVALVGDF